MGEIKDCFEFSKDERPKKTLAGYFGDELEIRTSGIEAATNYISNQIPSKTGSHAAIGLAFLIGTILGVLIARVSIPL